MIRIVYLVIVLSFGFSSLIAKEKKTKKSKIDSTITAKVMSLDTVSAKKDTVKTPAKDKDALKSIKEFTSKCKKMNGLFNLYQDTTTGKLYLEVSADKLGKEFIYFAHSVNGVIEAGWIKGGYRDNSVFKIEKYFDRIDFRIQNTNFYFNPENALSKAKDVNINQPLFLSEKIVAKDNDAYLIDADNFFHIETITQIKPSKSPTAPPDAFSVGNLNKAKSEYLWLKNFPSNTDVAVSYVYENPTPINYGMEEVTDARFVTLSIQHSLIEMPINNYQPRFDDPRVGYFMDRVTDQTSTSPVPYRDVIHRWDLQKKNPDEALSEPIVPIVWWIENTTPVEFRETIKQAVLAWNIAFEKAGFKNAVQCYVQPDDADWQAEDIRYNVLRWTSSPHPPFGGYGPHFVNPRTGQTLGADIMLEHIYLTNRLIYEKLFDVSAAEELITGNNGINSYGCSIGEHMHQNILSGLQLLSVYEFSDFDKKEFLKQALFDLVLHEVGHTFGLNHNFIASHLHSPEQLQDINLTKEQGLTSSVMDYTIPNISPIKEKQGLFFDTQPGTYDVWAIQYGYTQFKNIEEEKTKLKEILQSSNTPEHLFFNDGDDMRSSGKGIDPRVMIDDMSSDPIAYAVTNTKLSKETIGKLLDKYSKEDQSYQAVRNAFIVLTNAIGRNMRVVSRFIGGIYVDRSFNNQNSPNKPYTPVPLETQKKAMNALSKYCFAPNAFKLESSIYNYLQWQRRGYNREGNEDPKLHDKFFGMQKAVLDQLLHKDVLQRIVDTKLYGNKYDINTMLTDLSNAIFAADLGSNVNSIRQNIQGEYITRLLKLIEPNASTPASVKSAIFAQVDKIQKWMEANSGGDIYTKGHRKNILFLIKESLDK